MGSTLQRHVSMMQTVQLLISDQTQLLCDYRKVPKFSDTRKLCCKLPKIQTNLRVILQKDANGIANSEDPNQTAPLGAV